MFIRRPDDTPTHVEPPPAPAAAPKLEQLLSLVGVLAALIAVAALGVLALRAMLRLEPRWDTFAYHMPFAAERAGIDIPFDMPERLRHCYEGFPPLPELLQGILWRLTGTMNATGVVGFLGFIAFLAYSHRVLRAKFWLVALIALSAPLVIIHAAASYADLVGNSFLAISAGSCLSMLLFPERTSRVMVVGGLLGATAAAWSKLQLAPLAGVFLVLVTVLSIRRKAQTRLSRRTLVMLHVSAVVLAAAPYIKNLAVYGNPFWPVRVPVIGNAFPYTIDAMAEGTSSRPAGMQDASQPELFVHSLFEIHHPTHYDNRPRWIIDQGNASVAFRMGGFWGAGVVIYLLATLALFVLHDRRRGLSAAAWSLGVLALVACLPQSNELRYYMFLPLSWAVGFAMTFPTLRRRNPWLALGALASTIGLFAYMAHENSEHYAIEPRGYREAATEYGAATIWRSLRPNTTYCAVGVAPFGILLTGPTLTEFTIIERENVKNCPAGATILDRSGIARASELINQSLAAYQARRFDDVVRLAQQAIAIDPSAGQAWNNECAALSKLGRADEAIPACERAVALMNDELSRNNLREARTGSESGQVQHTLELYQQGHFADVVVLSRQIVAHNPRSEAGWTNECAALCMLERWSEALAPCEQAAALEPANQLAQNNLAWARSGLAKTKQPAAPP